MKFDTPLPARPVLRRYEQQAAEFLRAFKNGEPDALRWVRRYHSKLPGRPNTNERNGIPDSTLRKLKFTLADARFVLARIHLFDDWPKFIAHIEALNEEGSAVAQFEAAVEAIIDGNLTKLKQLLRQNPALIHARSTREHRATLLHYTSANAVEGYRQRTPKNIVAITRTLLEAGAEVDADLDYSSAGGLYADRTGSATLGLAATSCHPAEAGVQIPLLDLLLKHGAKVNGLRGGWNPLIGALHNGRGEAAAHLAKRGARLDLEGALGVGDLAAVKKFVTKHGRLKRNATKKQMELGLMWACQYGHAGVVEFFIALGVDTNAQPHGETALHWAAYAGHARIVKALLKQKPPLHVKDRHFNGTPLGWALYGWCTLPSESKRRGYYEIVSRLIAAGSVLDEDWLDEGKRGVPILKKIRGDRRMIAALRR
jgi:ankyrin repeat protein